MISGTSPKIRIVRCPRCRNILPELPDFPVYECGGCGAHLQAKVRKENAKSTASGLPETDASKLNKLDLVSEDKESSSLSHETILHSEGECSPYESNGRGQIESGNCNDDKPTGSFLTNEDENNASDQNVSEDFDIEQLKDANLSNADQKSGSDKNESAICDYQQVRGVNLSDEDHNNDSHQNESLACNVEPHGVSNEDCSSDEPSHLSNGMLSHSPLSRTNSEVEFNDESLPLAAKAKLKAEADANNESDSVFRRSRQEELVDTKGTTSIDTAQQPAGESISSDILISSPKDHVEQPQEIAHHGFACVRSIDAFEIEDFVNPSSELSGTLIDLSKSPTTRSSRAYYDDGVSSYEGTDDQLPDRHKHSSKHAYRLANYAASDVRPRRERFPINNSNETQHHFRTSASFLPERTRYAIKSSRMDRDELLEPTRLGHPGRNWRRLARDEYLSQPAFRRRDSLASYESGSPSNYNELYYNSSFAGQDKPVYSEQEKMKLLRMVYELQYQLNNPSRNDKPNGGVTWKDHYIPTYYDRELLQEESLRNLVYPRFAERIREGDNWSQQKKYSQIPFSADATNSRHKVDYSMCCCPQEWQRTTQFPPPGFRRNKGYCRVHSHLNLYNSYGSCPSSPQRHVESEIPTYCRGTKSADQRLRNHEVERYWREKHYLAKRRLRPVAGGAPFITCYCCSNQLLLPADFLLFKRRCHRLKCGACSEVLKFSLQGRTHLIPYTISAEAPPPSEVDEYSDAIHRRNFTSTSHVSGPYTDSVSCSDDCGLAFCKSCSTDKDLVSQIPVHAIHSNEVQRNVSRGSLEHSTEKRKFASNETRNKGKNPVQTCELAGPSSSTSKSNKVSSEIEELPAGGGGSPLHRLMGYSSPSDLIYGWGPSVSYLPEM
ncbi:hypothetical protein P3X46_025886 [Hevea brasiliensis]|uniref:Zinc-ribbon domain-containing protein n=1 Tax=Hevea brasiliensis TaxID=3981 RepID=A0ABQ9L9P0_HEVBR|nr:uncharacterized protein LOC110633913 [Hevea brasiliensis]XP_057989899.1 uncharacterized protein LOC110633913 [Hevea brasiliensis]KAJ9160488.1 hypothetical protein P3X46_025886 [Hevea brasiliensis]